MGEKAVSEHVIHSQLYGELRPDEHQVYHFHQGIVGFSHLQQFALLPYEDSQLFILQAFYEELSLLLIPATSCANAADFHIDDEVVSALGIEKEEDVVAFYIMRFIDNEAYINLKAPILIVPSTQKGCQYVIVDDKVQVRERLIMAGEADARS